MVLSRIILFQTPACSVSLPWQKKENIWLWKGIDAPNIGSLLREKFFFSCFLFLILSQLIFGGDLNIMSIQSVIVFFSFSHCDLFQIQQRTHHCSIRYTTNHVQHPNLSHLTMFMSTLCVTKDDSFYECSPWLYVFMPVLHGRR